MTNGQTDRRTGGRICYMLSRAKNDKAYTLPHQCQSHVYRLPKRCIWHRSWVPGRPTFRPGHLSGR